MTKEKRATGSLTSLGIKLKIRQSNKRSNWTKDPLLCLLAVNFMRSLDHSTGSRSAPHWRRHEYDPVSPDEQHRDVPLCGVIDLFVGLLIDLNSGNGLLDVALEMKRREDRSSGS